MNREWDFWLLYAEGAYCLFRGVAVSPDAARSRRLRLLWFARFERDYGKVLEYRRTGDRTGRST